MHCFNLKRAEFIVWTDALKNRIANGLNSSIIIIDKISETVQMWPIQLFPKNL